MKIYIIVSQGIKIAEFKDKTEALLFLQESNNDFYYYKQECLDAGEPYADNEVFMYEEDF